MTGIVIAAACNAQAILDANLARSPLLGQGVRLVSEFGAPSASVAYNRMLDATDEPFVVFAHQDVFLPKGWDAVLRARIAEVAALDPNWALLGAFGVGLDGAHIGPVWSSSLGMIVGRVPLVPVAVQSYDEMLIVLRRASGLRFDEGLPGWHMYGTDIAQTARAAGMGAWAGALPTVHNDRYHGALGPDFTECYRFMQRKWQAALPLRTPITKISGHGLHLLRDQWQNRQSAGFRLGMAVGTDTDPAVLAGRCGWADLSACG
ncbi:hypothetical protein [Rhodobacter ferrooxidans]|uniref:Glycosyltransferase like family protein n=1 Tax=Rhodobacter ferrooxidans TaxID=371731 RepID=C8RXI1_9RHOB|nr:hypothetical protein [Rhodobacter sp. SW2]EEW26706.1 hypothetical protein Rsw2DRAFT_0509 [Rhodobacter sp. SW2]